MALGACLVLTLLIGVEATIFRPQRTSVLSWLASPLEKVTAGLSDNEGFISSVQGTEGNISGYGCGSVQMSYFMGNLSYPNIPTDEKLLQPSDPHILVAITNVFLLFHR